MSAIKLSIDQTEEGISPSYFLHLPTELRQEIYNYVLGIPTLSKVEVFIDNDRYTSSYSDSFGLQCSKSPQIPPSLAIFRSNRQIYREALPLLYRCCNFFPLDDDVLNKFFGRMPGFARSNILRLHLKPRPQKAVRRLGPPATLSQVMKGPSWIFTCETISHLFVALEEILIYLHPL